MKTNINVKEFAYALANSGDDDQAELINVFAYELKVVCRDSGLTGFQICAISRLLDSNGIDFINSLHEFIKLREDNKPKIEKPKQR